MSPWRPSVHTVDVLLTYERLQAAQAAIEAVGSDIPKPEFIDLLAGFELFTRTGTALPDETIEYDHGILYHTFLADEEHFCMS